MTNESNYWNQNPNTQPTPQSGVQQPTAQQPVGQQPATQQPAGQQPSTQQPVSQTYQQVQPYAQPQGGQYQSGYGQVSNQQAAPQQAYQTPHAPYVAPTGQPPYSSAPPASAGYAAAPARQKKSFGWIVAIVFIVCLFIFTAFCVKMCTDAVNSVYPARGASAIGDVSGDVIGIIDLDGTIQYDGTECSPEGLKDLLDQAADNEHVKALVLRVNSGGGTATAGEEMAEYLRQFGKPVVVSSASINASAAYEISAQADYIYVAKSTEIGAIGTVMELTDLSGLFEKLGINMEVIASAESKDSSYGYRALTEDERTYYQNMVNQINEMFIENVAIGRKMEIEDVRKLATGLVFTGVDAVSNGLADGVGTREDAIAKAAELAGISSYDTVDMQLTSYDISELATLFGESRASLDDILDELAGSQEAKTK